MKKAWYEYVFGETIELYSTMFQAGQKSISGERERSYKFVPVGGSSKPYDL